MDDGNGWTYVAREVPAERPVFQSPIGINAKLCERYYLPDKNLTIDEGTRGFWGRVHFKVFNKDKPDTYGMKIYMLCYSEMGYALRMIPYVGDSKTSTKSSLPS
ncbi:hypothetical protein EVAR_7092_1 [Eumeta japonica]|uniref:PiggyBac transposable element-derived protein domain-containing protein n=1 Tax=Eumeta variegata TaxID=151549 RepID=A0A4C1YAP6_EUMVA|nr:hypothetical protein EVAR_7092_1 [Eumeta japonica]